MAATAKKQLAAKQEAKQAIRWRSRAERTLIE